jgi:hypothetical protein
MNNTPHTPTPWYIAHHSDINGGQSIDIRHCCDIPPFTPEIHQIARLPENAMANARLIAAAPDLLSALDLILNKINAHGLKNKHMIAAIEKAELAIAKAKGEA